MTKNPDKKLQFALKEMLSSFINDYSDLAHQVISGLLKLQTLRTLAHSGHLSDT
jgi:hypothetical protein